MVLNFSVYSALNMIEKDFVFLFQYFPRRWLIKRSLNETSAQTQYCILDTKLSVEPGLYPRSVAFLFSSTIYQFSTTDFHIFSLNPWSSHSIIAIHDQNRVKSNTITHLRVTQPLPEGGAVQNTCILVRLLGMLSVTAGGQLVMNCVSLSSMSCGTGNIVTGFSKNI